LEWASAVAPPLLGKGRRFNKMVFNDVPIEDVDRVPHSIDGLCVYRIQVTPDNHLDKLSDGRYFRLNRTQKHARTYNKIGTCMGSYECSNASCPKLLSSGTPMTHQWAFNRDTREKVCFSCKQKGVRIHCGAVKLEEYDEISGEVVVYHIGKHICEERPNTKKNHDSMRAAISSHGHLGPKHIQRELITSKIRQHDWRGAAEIASALQDTRQLRYMKRKSGKHSVLDRNSMAVIGQLKSAMSSEKGWEYYIYEMNDGNMNNQENYVFKSSKVSAQLMLELEDGGVLEGETVYFDGMHKRVSGYTTLTLWVYHPALRKLLRLATMEAKGENTKNITNFFHVVDRMLTSVAGEPKQLNPAQILVDENGANFKAIQNVYGTRRVVSCQFHFKNNAQIRARMLPPEKEVEFMSICHEMCHVATFERYMQLTDDIVRVANGNQAIIKWFDWWDMRRFHLFPAFRGPLFSGVNLAEAGHSGMTTDKPLMILDACYDDASYMIAQDYEVVKFQRGQGRSSGQGPSQQEILFREEEAQRKRVFEYIEVLKKDPKMPTLSQLLRNMRAAHFIPKTSDSHKPPKKRKRGRKRTDYEATELPLPQQHDRHDTPDAASLDDAEWIGIGSSPTLQDANDCNETTLSSLDMHNVDILNSLEQDNVVSDTSEHMIHVTIAGPPKPICPPNTPYSLANPVVLKFREGNISKCQGCHMEILKENTKHPRNLVFSIKARRSWVQKETGLVRTNPNPAPIYFHLDVACVQKYFQPQQWSMEDMRVEPKTFERLSKAHIEYLDDLGYLQHLLM
jgi:hypothetical protein